MHVSADFNCENIKTQNVDVENILVKRKKNERKKKKKHSLNSSFKSCAY